ncbi:unnamed protein product [Caenorhabditis brenneri]
MSQFQENYKNKTIWLLQAKSSMLRSTLQCYGGEPAKPTQFQREVKKARGSIRFEPHARNKLKPLTRDFVQCSNIL